MKNIPRIFIGKNIIPHTNVATDKNIAHYLLHVMRRRDCLVFGDGFEYTADLTPDAKYLTIGERTNHTDPSGDITVYFAPIKKTDDLLNMATQMGAGCFVPVITARTVANHINWERMRKIVTEAAEQSNRNTVPEIMSPIKFSDLPFADLVFADERAAYGRDIFPEYNDVKNILVGPEGGFSDSEFDILDKNGAHGLSLGKTILRAELAAPIALSRVMK